MRRRQPYRRPIPTIWLMTDERADAGLEAALHRLPRGAGVVFRHYSLAPKERRTRYEQVRAITRRRKLVLVLAGPTRQAIAWRADGAHNRGPYGPVTRLLLRTAPAHDGPALVRARIADLAFLSPVYPTRSHPDARALGPVRFGLMMKRGCRSIALGGMNARRWQHLARLGARGWAAIDAWSTGSGQTACL
jgi:thiamine-phosphate pyrophosphorylase